jgi:hypothetical protein
MTRIKHVVTGVVSRIAIAGSLMATAACTIVVPPPPKEKKVVVVEVPGKDPPKPVPLEAHALFVMNLHQSSANLSQYYVTIASSLIAGLTERGINVARWAVIPTYPGAEGMKLLFGAQTPTAPPTLPPIPGFGGAGGSTSARGSADASGLGGSFGPIPAPAFDNAAPTIPPDLPAVPTLPNGTDIVTTLQKLAATGKYDGIGTTNEAEGVIRTGTHLVEARLPADLGGLDGAAFFDRPRSLFLVIYLQPLARKCAMSSSDCTVDGRSPAEIFTEANPDGTAAWLHFATGGIPIKQVVHVAIDTKEGESAVDFRTRCKLVNGFPANLLDVMEPSPTQYFDPLVAALNTANKGSGQAADLCNLLGEIGLPQPTQRTTLNALVNSIASMAGPAPDTTSPNPTSPGPMTTPPPLTP